MKKYPIVVYPDNEATSPSCVFYLLPENYFYIFLNDKDEVVIEADDLAAHLKILKKLDLVRFTNEAAVMKVANTTTGRYLNLDQTLFKTRLAEPNWSPIATLNMANHTGTYPSDILSMSDLYPECILDAGEFIEDYGTVEGLDSYRLVSTRLLSDFENKGGSMLLSNRLDHILMTFYFHEAAVLSRELASDASLIEGKIQLLIDMLVRNYKDNPGVRLTSGELIDSSYFEDSKPTNYFNSFRSLMRNTSKNWDTIDNELPTPPSTTEGNRIGRICELEFKTKNARYLDNSRAIQNAIETCINFNSTINILYGNVSSSSKIKLKTHDSNPVVVKDDDTLAVKILLYLEVE